MLWFPCSFLIFITFSGVQQLLILLTKSSNWSFEFLIKWIALVNVVVGSITDRQVHFQRNVVLQLCVHPWIIDNWHQLTRTYVIFFYQCFLKRFLQKSLVCCVRFQWVQHSKFFFIMLKYWVTVVMTNLKATVHVQWWIDSGI